MRHARQAYKTDNYDKVIPTKHSTTDTTTAVKVIEASGSDSSWICKECHKSLKSGRVPKMAISNHMGVPIPADDNERLLRSLNHVEERFVSPRIPFVSIYRVRPNNQCRTKGHSVVIPIKFGPTVARLPRAPTSTGLINV